MARKTFVMMPSGTNNEYKDGRDEADFIYHDIICVAVKTAFGVDADIQREVDESRTGAIDKNIITKIAEADYCIVDITGHNPNVFFELGVRYTLSRQNTVLLQQEGGPRIPFDISRYRIVHYSPKYSGVRRAVETLTAVLQSSIGEQDRTDSPVYDVLSNLKIEKATPARHRDPAMMPWPEYLAQCRRVETMLREKVKSRHYTPDVVVGITHGGMIFAEILAQEQVIERKLEILLVDDNVATGSSFRKALTFLRAGLPDAVIAFLPLFTRNRKYLSAIGEKHLIWKRPEFADPPVDPTTLHHTEWEKREELTRGRCVGDPNAWSPLRQIETGLH